MKRKTQIVKAKIFDLSNKTLSSYQTNVLLDGLKFAPIPKCSNTDIKSNIQNWLAEFFHNKEPNDFEKNIFQKQCTFTPPWIRDRDLDHQTDDLNNLNLEEMETKSKSNLFNMD